VKNIVGRGARHEWRLQLGNVLYRTDIIIAIGLSLSQSRRKTPYTAQCPIIVAPCGRVGCRLWAVEWQGCDFRESTSSQAVKEFEGRNSEKSTRLNTICGTEPHGHTTIDGTHMCTHMYTPFPDHLPRRGSFATVTRKCSGPVD
jgi:hypothetical protein